MMLKNKFLDIILTIMIINLILLGSARIFNIFIDNKIMNIITIIILALSLINTLIPILIIIIIIIIYKIKGKEFSIFENNC